MEMKRGFKQTEIGIIPEDWEVQAFNKLGQVVDGDRGVNYPSNNEFLVDGYCLFLSAKNVTKEGFRFDDCVFISEGKDSLLGKGKLKRWDVVLTTRGTVGNFAYFNDAVPFENVRINSGMVILRREDDKIIREYLYEILKSQVVEKQIDRVVFGSAQPQLTVGIINKFQIPFPRSKDEQHAIAAALSDVDALLTALDALITKKRHIKQGAMQELLTGKRRLAESPREDYKQTEIGTIPTDWGVDSIRDHALITTGAKNTQDKIEDGAYPFFVRSSTVERINSFSFDGEAVLTAGDGVGTGKVFHYINEKFDFHQRVYKISDFKPDLNGYFFYLYFSNHFYDRIMSMTAKSSVDSVRMEMIADMKIPLPPILEQHAIAEILSDMDAEIAALEQRREKTRLLKQGMMQELLTGRIRLL